MVGSLFRSLQLLPLLALLLPTIACAYGDECWEGFGMAGVDGEVRALAIDGDDLYVAGGFRTAAGINVGGIARWSLSEHRWYPVGRGEYPGVNGSIHAMAIVGDSIYVGGEFTSAGSTSLRNIAVFDRRREEWSAWGGGAGRGFGGAVHAIAVSSGSIYAGGDFSAIGTTLAGNIARWDGTRWHQLQGGTVGEVHTIAVVGSDLYVGGSFTAAGTVQTPNIARWDGSRWSALGKGINGPVYTIGRDGGDLLVGGMFTKADTVSAASIVRYTPASSRWQALGSGVGGSNTPPPSLGIVYAVARLGGDLYVGGDFMRAGTEVTTTRRIARWDGSRWYALRDSSVPNGQGIASDRGGEPIIRSFLPLGDDLYVAGRFDTAFAKTFRPGISDDGMSFPYVALNVVRWNASARQWLSLGDAPNHYITALASVGGDVYMAGRFSTAGGVVAMNIAGWNLATRSWRPLGAGLGNAQSSVRAIAVDSAGVIHAAVRDERDAAEAIVPVASYVGRWNPATGSWSYLGTKMTGMEIFAIAADANAVYIGGRDTAPGSSGFLTWNGTAWSAPGGGVNGRVSTIAIEGDWVYVGGEFTMAGTVPASNIARLNRATGVWESLGSGVDSTVHTIASANGRIYVGGAFTMAGGKSVGFVASWDQVDRTWRSLGSGLNGPVRGLAQRRGIIYAGGDFTSTGEATVPHVAMWDGEVWSGLGTGVNGAVGALAIGIGGLFVAGDFDVAGNRRAAGLARWDNVTLAVDAAPAVTGAGVLLECHPNPFTGIVTIRCMIPSSQRRLFAVSRPLRIDITDRLGRPVATLAVEATGGAHHLAWNGEGVPAGIYFCRIEWEGEVHSVKLVKLN